MEKLEKFPRISNKEPLKLRQLGDLLRELESPKLEGYLSGLAILDTSRGVKPIVEKLPYGLQEKRITQGSLYKLEYHVQFPPFSSFVEFVCKEAHFRNDPSFTLSSSFGVSAMKPDNLAKTYTYSKGHVSAHKTDITATLNTSKLDINRLCPIHKKPHPLKRCRGFRAKTLEERKAFLKESGICFKCCSSTNHRAQDCKIVINCKECDSNKHVTALHPGPAPWTTQDPDVEHGGERREEACPNITSKCTAVCGEGNSSWSCSKICLIKVHPVGQQDRSMLFLMIRVTGLLLGLSFLTCSILRVQIFPTLCTHVLELQRCLEEEGLASSLSRWMEVLLFLFPHS